MHYCANMITAFGIGNGSTLVICTGIVTEYAETLHLIMTGLEAGAMDPAVSSHAPHNYLCVESIPSSCFHRGWPWSPLATWRW